MSESKTSLPVQSDLAVQSTSQSIAPQEIDELCSLDELPARAIATLVRFNTSNVSLETRLREIGFAEGDEVQPLHYGLFGGTPINVRLNGALIALRRAEARAIYVRRENSLNTVNDVANKSVKGNSL